MARGKSFFNRQDRDQNHLVRRARRQAASGERRNDGTVKNAHYVRIRREVLRALQAAEAAAASVPEETPEKRLDLSLTKKKAA